LNITANCCVNYDYMILTDQFGPNNGVMEVYLSKHSLGFS